MDVRQLLEDGFQRVADLLPEVADGLDDEALHHRPGGTGNPIGWLLWHLTRVQDEHLAGITGEAQLWETWQERFGLPHGPDDIGYGHTSEQVDAVRIDSADLLAGYHADVHVATLSWLREVDEAALDRVVDERWDPPVTAGVRLVSVQGDALQHLGQAAYVRGLLAV
jgi:hypothetical protein